MSFSLHVVKWLITTCNSAFQIRADKHYDAVMSSRA